MSANIKLLMATEGERISSSLVMIGSYFCQNSTQGLNHLAFSSRTEPIEATFLSPPSCCSQPGKMHANLNLLPLLVTTLPIHVLTYAVYSSHLDRPLLNSHGL